jgi:hypothetical protein
MPAASDIFPVSEFSNLIKENSCLSIRPMASP